MNSSHSCSLLALGSDRSTRRLVARTKDAWWVNLASFCLGPHSANGHPWLPQITAIQSTRIERNWEIVVPRRRGPPEAKTADPPPEKVKKPAGANFSVSEIVADGTVLQVLSKKPGRDPLRFDLRRLAGFTSREQVDELSRRGQGKPGNPDVSGVEVGALFSMAGGVIQFRKLTFGVPAALVNLDGGYGLRSEEFDFQGTLTLDVKVSETTSGVKSLLLRAVDRLLTRDGEGSVVPIKISGTFQSTALASIWRRLSVAENERVGQRMALTSTKHPPADLY